MVEDLPISGKRVFLHVPRRKVHCFEDGTISVEKIAWIRKRFSLRFAEQIYRRTAIATNQKAGWYLSLDDETVYSIDKCMLEKLAQERRDSSVTPTLISVDEVSWQIRHKYVTNVIDIEKRKVIWNHNGYFRRYQQQDQKAIPYGIRIQGRLLLLTQDPSALRDA